MARPVLGSKYTGIPYDRPALRRMPDGWRLANIDHRPRSFRPMGNSVLYAIVAILAMLFVAQMVIR